MTTPQRALELAREIARKLDPHFPAQELSDFEKALACQALYHYVEIMQAEVVGEIHHGRQGHIYWAEDPEELENGTLLIIKPKPLP